MFQKLYKYIQEGGGGGGGKVSIHTLGLVSQSVNIFKDDD